MAETATPPSLPSYRLVNPPESEKNEVPQYGETNWMKTILIILFIVIVLLVAYTIFQTKSQNMGDQTPTASSSATQDATIDKGTNPARLIGVKETYLKLDSTLYQLTKTKNYQEYGKRYQLYIADNKVRVEIELKDTNFKLPAGFGSEEKRNGEFLQALVPIDKLVELTEDIRIVAIRVPRE